MRITVLVAALLAALPATALANRGVDSSWYPVADSPVVGKCAAMLRDTDVGNVNYYLSLWVRFDNSGARTISAIEFRFTLLDTFGSVLGNVSGEQDGTFSQGAIINPQSNIIGTPQPQWSFINTWPTLATVRCSVNRIKFDDGEVWESR